MKSKSDIDCIKEMRAFIAKKKKNTRLRNQQLWAQANKDAKKIIKMIVSKFQPQAVY